MRKILIVTFFCFLSGCTQSPMNKAKQDFACKDNGGVYRYVASIAKAHCLDNTRIDGWYDMKLTPEYYPIPKEQARD